MSIAAKLRKLKQANYRETAPVALPDGTQVILSTLSGDEDRAMADYLMQYRDKSFGHYVKLETLAYAIKWILPTDGTPIDLRGLDTVETGEVNGANVPIKVKRHIFMRELVNSWPDVVVDALFTKWSVLIEDLEKGVQKTAQIELGDAALIMKIDAVETELKGLVLEATKRGVDLPRDLTRNYGISTREEIEEGEDALANALKRLAPQAEEPAPEPQDVHPADEQLAREMSENPDVYPGRRIEEAPRPIRR
jgi:hypothetical protein